MFFGETIEETRSFFFSAWQKYKTHQTLSPFERQLADVIMQHPEYHTLLEASGSQQKHYFPELGETNPFLHLGFHLAIRDQISLNRPDGITVIYQKLLQQHADPLVVEHLLMDALAECLWQAQRQKTAPNEQDYIMACEKLTF